MTPRNDLWFPDKFEHTHTVPYFATETIFLSMLLASLPISYLEQQQQQQQNQPFNCTAKLDLTKP